MESVSIKFYDGPSTLDGTPIIGVLTGLLRPSSNPKTGPMVQSWIINKKTHPHLATQTGEDVAICGNCPRRHFLGGNCYVIPNFAPANVYKNNHTLPDYPDLPLLRGKKLRIGSYGDPVAIPYPYWEKLLQHTVNHTGYTHQWRTCDQRFRYILMASTDSPEESLEANAKGWRYYEATSDPTPTPNSIMCPSPTGTTCYNCCACNGTNHKPNRLNIKIKEH